MAICFEKVSISTNWIVERYLTPPILWGESQDILDWLWLEGPKEPQCMDKGSLLTWQHRNQKTEITLNMHVFFLVPCLLLTWLLFVSFPHLISPEVLRQDPVVDVIRETREETVDNFRGAPLWDAFSDSISVGTIGEGEELPVYAAPHLRDAETSLTEAFAHCL